jgi:hypothetical protein
VVEDRGETTPNAVAKAAEGTVVKVMGCFIVVGASIPTRMDSPAVADCVCVCVRVSPIVEFTAVVAGGPVNVALRRLSLDNGNITV